MNTNYNKERYKQIAIRISPEEAEEIKAKAGEMHISIARLIVSACKAYSPETLTASTDNPGEITTTTPTTGATEMPTEGRQENAPDYIRQDENAPQRAAESVREGVTKLTHSPTGKYYPARRDHTENGSESENTPGQVKIYTETDLKQAIQEAATQAAQEAARETRQEIRRELKVQAIQATAHTIGAARRAKESTVSAVNGLKSIRIKRPKK